MPAKKSAAVQALAEAIRDARQERGFSQERFAAHVALDRSYYGAIERGEFNVTVQTLLRISGGLGVSASTLLKRAKV